MKIRRAEDRDIGAVLRLLSQVLEIHAEIRPDLFMTGTRKYTEEELRKIFRDDSRPVFVAETEEGEVAGYCFCMLEHTAVNAHAMRESSSLYIDDLCVDERSRGQHVGRLLYEYVLEYARSMGCYDITLNVWEGNDGAKAFYEKMGFVPRKTCMEKIV